MRVCAKAKDRRGRAARVQRRGAVAAQNGDKGKEERVAVSRQKRAARERHCAALAQKPSAGRKPPTAAQNEQQPRARAEGVLPRWGLCPRRDCRNSHSPHLVAGDVARQGLRRPEPPLRPKAKQGASALLTKAPRCVSGVPRNARLPLRRLPVHGPAQGGGRALGSRKAVAAWRLEGRAGSLKN